MVFVHLLCFLLEKSLTSVTTMVLDEWKARWDKVILLTQAITEKSIKKKKKTWKKAKTIASWSRLFNLTNLYEKWFKIHWLQIILFVRDVSCLFCSDFQTKHTMSMPLTHCLASEKNLLHIFVSISNIFK